MFIWMSIVGGRRHWWTWIRPINYWVRVVRGRANPSRRTKCCSRGRSCCWDCRWKANLRRLQVRIRTVRWWQETPTFFVVVVSECVCVFEVNQREADKDSKKEIRDKTVISTSNQKPTYRPTFCTMVVLRRARVRARGKKQERDRVRREAARKRESSKPNVTGHLPGDSRDLCTGTPPVNTRFMSSIEHWNTSMYRCFFTCDWGLMHVIYLWWRWEAARAADCSLSIWIKASPDGCPWNVFKRV